MRVYVYVDGFNLYYRALKGTPHKWLNLVALSQRLVAPGDTIEFVRYFTARVSARAGDPDAPRRQQILFNALRSELKVIFHLGTFLANTKWRPLASNPAKFVEILNTEEKGSDVNLAVHLVNDAWLNRYDVALVMSQDSDLIEPMRIAKDERGKKIGLIWLDGGRPNPKMVAASSFARHISNADLVASQFPNPIVKLDGTQILKPATW